ncbi:MAG: hypothetical protein ACLU3G_03655 [Christensenellales bacterium]
MKKKISGWITAAVCLLLIIALYFLAPAHPIDAGEITYATVTRSDDHIDLKGKRIEDINELFAEVTAKRCFAPANITEDESTLMVDITTNDGPMHIVFGDEVYLYSSADNIIWYRLENALYLRLFVENLPHVEE